MLPTDCGGKSMLKKNIRPARIHRGALESNPYDETAKQRLEAFGK
jgi:hypothetical protein